jgi:hypothetical protein
MNGRREDHLLAAPTFIGSVDPDALKIPARRAEYSLTESALSPFHAEPRHHEAFGEDNLWSTRRVLQYCVGKLAFDDIQ